MDECKTCTQKGKERAKAFEATKNKAKIKAHELQETIAICKKGKDGDFFICTRTEAFAGKYAVIDFVSYVQ